MITIALRFGEQFSPETGTIAEHQRIIDTYGFVWYGKMGSRVSQDIIDKIMSNDNPMILLIRSGKPERYWAKITEIKRELPEVEYIPEYYRENARNFKTWFKVKEFQPTEKNVMRQCVVISSGMLLSLVSRRSPNPYYIIDYKNE